MSSKSATKTQNVARFLPIICKNDLEICNHLKGKVDFDRIDAFSAMLHGHGHADTDTI